MQGWVLTPAIVGWARMVPPGEAPLLALPLQSHLDLAGSVRGLCILQHPSRCFSLAYHTFVWQLGHR